MDIGASVLLISIIVSTIIFWILMIFKPSKKIENYLSGIIIAIKILTELFLFFWVIIELNTKVLGLLVIPSIILLFVIVVMIYHQIRDFIEKKSTEKKNKNNESILNSKSDDKKKWVDEVFSGDNLVKALDIGKQQKEKQKEIERKIKKL